jgi:signal transduction histidine kinase
MAIAVIHQLRTLIRIVNPRRSQAAGVLWLIVGLSITFSIAAAVWVGGIARDNVVEQHARRLALETDQLSSDLSQAIAARLGAIRGAEGTLAVSGAADPAHRLAGIYHELTTVYPQFEWMLIATAAGTVVSSDAHILEGTDLSARPWFSAALEAPWLGVIEEASDESRESPHRQTVGVTALGDMAAPVRDSAGHTLGVLVTHLRWQRSPNPTERLTDEADPQSHAQASLLDRGRVVIVGSRDLRGKPWSGIPISGLKPVQLAANSPGDATLEPHFEHLPDGRQILVARAQLSSGSGLSAESWLVQLSEPNDRVYQRANAVARRILWVSVSLGILTALLGAFGAHHLTNRLKRLALSVASVERNEATHIEIPSGIDEVAQLASAFANVLNDLQRERTELKTLSRELERRVAVRTSEVERLAEETRYAAIVRERLKIARDLHDTLAHSMMAILSEIRFLRRLQTHDPAAVTGELARAEEVAHEGLKEVRAAITQMRVTAVRDTGLGPALSTAFERFIDHTGLEGEFNADIEAARFGDERAETLVRMAQEALRNIERHARATRVVLTLNMVEGNHLVLRIEDNGIGFDPEANRTGHYGIVGLHEQADMIGAELRMESKVDEGTKVCISLSVSPIAFGQAV